VVAVGGFYVLALLRGLSASVDLTTVILTMFALSWLVLPIFALIELLGQVIPNAASAGGITAASFAGVDAWMRWLPPDSRRLLY
jgi:hypothetical protein